MMAVMLSTAVEPSCWVVEVMTMTAAPRILQVVDDIADVEIEPGATC